jgi:hypothetical protein
MHRRHFSADDVCKETNQLKDVESDDEEYMDIPPSKPRANDGQEAATKNRPQQPRRKKGRFDLRKPRNTVYEYFDETEFGERRPSYPYERRKSLLALELKADEETSDTSQPSSSALAYNKILNQKM